MGGRRVRTLAPFRLRPDEPPVGDESALGGTTASATHFRVDRVSIGHQGRKLSAQVCVGFRSGFAFGRGVGGKSVRRVASEWIVFGGTR
jgi:hypothetical protein